MFNALKQALEKGIHVLSHSNCCHLEMTLEISQEHKNGKAVFVDAFKELQLLETNAILFLQIFTQQVVIFAKEYYFPWLNSNAK